MIAHILNYNILPTGCGSCKPEIAWPGSSEFHVPIITRSCLVV